MPSAPEASLTAYVARFITETKASRIPSEVMHLGKRSILDGIGLALAGNAAESGNLVRQYLKTLGCPTDKGCTVIGTTLKVPARFAAFANGIAIHADDYDDGPSHHDHDHDHEHHAAAVPHLRLHASGQQREHELHESRPRRGPDVRRGTGAGQPGQ